MVSNCKRPAAEGHEAAAKKPRMPVNRLVGSSDARYNQAVELFKAAGYTSTPPSEFEEIHCLQNDHAWIENGFLQTYAEVDGQRCRVCIYFPKQELVPQRHDLDQNFLITHGSVELWVWSSPQEKSYKMLERGQHLVVSAGTVHCLRANPRAGLVFHELVGEQTFGKRSTEWIEDVPLNDYLMPSPFAGKTVLVTGANRGLGLGLARALVAAGARVVACCRSLDKVDGLASLSPKPLMVALDVGSEESVRGLRGRLEVLGVHALDYLINNAGISSPNHPNDPILEADTAVIKSVFNVNVVGTTMVTKACLPLLEAAPTRTVANLSSQLASITGCFGVQGRFGGVCSYRLSRAAANMAMRCFAGELHEKGFIFASMSPGHVATDMGSAGGRKAELTVEQSVAGMLKVIGHLAPADNGKFLQWDWAELDW